MNKSGPLGRRFAPTTDGCRTYSGLQFLSIQLSGDTETANRPAKLKGGGVAVLAINRCCDPEHVTVKEHLCTTDIEQLSGSFCPWCYLLMLHVTLPISRQQLQQPTTFTVPLSATLPTVWLISNLFFFYYSQLIQQKYHFHLVIEKKDHSIQCNFI